MYCNNLSLYSTAHDCILLSITVHCMILLHTVIYYHTFKYITVYHYLFFTVHCSILLYIVIYYCIFQYINRFITIYYYIFSEGFPNLDGIISGFNTKILNFYAYVLDF